MRGRGSRPVVLNINASSVLFCFDRLNANKTISVRDRKVIVSIARSRETDVPDEKKLTPDNEQQQQDDDHEPSSSHSVSAYRRMSHTQTHMFLHDLSVLTQKLCVFRA